MSKEQLYGALPIYQIQFFVKGKTNDNLIARTRHSKSGNDINVKWEGGMLSHELNEDKELIGLLKKILADEGDIFVDPLDNGVRIYSRWRAMHKIKLSNDAIKAYNIIAKHVKKHLR